MKLSHRLLSAISCILLLGAATVAPPLMPLSGAPTQMSVTCGTTSTTLLPATQATTFLMVKVPAGTNTVWLDFSGNAAVTASPSLDIQAGGSVTWGVNGFLPLSQVNCISSVATAVTVIYR